MEEKLPWMAHTHQTREHRPARATTLSPPEFTMSKKFPTNIYVVHEDVGDGTTFLNAAKEPDQHAAIGCEVRVAHYVLDNVLKVTAPVKAETE